MPGIGDEIDSAMQASEKELLFELTDAERVMNDEIEAALTRIDKKFYGKCESCGCAIPIARLKAIPWVRNCMKCQSKTETKR